MVMRLQPGQTWSVFPRRLFIAEMVLAHIQYSTKFEFRTVPMRYFVFFLHKNVPQRLCPTFGVHFFLFHRGKSLLFQIGELFTGNGDELFQLPVL